MTSMKHTPFTSRVNPFGVVRRHGIVFSQLRLISETRLHTFREALVNDEERPEDTPVPDVEADVLRAMRESTLVVNQDRETPVTEGETNDEDEMTSEDMSGEEMSNKEEEDEESKLEVETKVGNDKEGNVPRVYEE